MMNTSLTYDDLAEAAALMADRLLAAQNENCALNLELDGMSVVLRGWSALTLARMSGRGLLRWAEELGLMPRRTDHGPS